MCIQNDNWSKLPARITEINKYFFQRYLQISYVLNHTDKNLKNTNNILNSKET